MHNEGLYEKRKRFPRLVLIVDNLDRCAPEKGMALLEALRVKMRLEGVFTIIGVNDGTLLSWTDSDSYFGGPFDEILAEEDVFPDDIFGWSCTLRPVRFNETIKSVYFSGVPLTTDGESLLEELGLTYRKWNRLSNRLKGIVLSKSCMEPSELGMTVLEACLPDVYRESPRPPRPDGTVARRADGRRRRPGTDMGVVRGE